MKNIICCEKIGNLYGLTRLKKPHNSNSPCLTLLLAVDIPNIIHYIFTYNLMNLFSLINLSVLHEETMHTRYSAFSMDISEVSVLQVTCNCCCTS